MSDATNRFVRDMLAATDQFELDTIRERLARYRPALATEFGESIAARVLDHPGLIDTARDLYEAAEIEADEVAHRAAAHLRNHPDAGVDEALAAARAGLAP